MVVRPGAAPCGTAEIVPAKNIDRAHKNTVNGQTGLIIVLSLAHVTAFSTLSTHRSYSLPALRQHRLPDIPSLAATLLFDVCHPASRTALTQQRILVAVETTCYVENPDLWTPKKEPALHSGLV